MPQMGQVPSLTCSPRDDVIQMPWQSSGALVTCPHACLEHDIDNTHYPDPPSSVAMHCNAATPAWQSPRKFLACSSRQAAHWFSAPQAQTDICPLQRTLPLPSARTDLAERALAQRVPARRQRRTNGRPRPATWSVTGHT